MLIIISLVATHTIYLPAVEHGISDPEESKDQKTRTCLCQTYTIADVKCLEQTIPELPRRCETWRNIPAELLSTTTT